jgi:23S rRNA (adenine1618-N6)-methyltransferase
LPSDPASDDESFVGSPSHAHAERPPGAPPLGLDVGCGANLVYALLGAAEFGWRFVAVDIAAPALAAARATLAANPHLGDLITVRAAANSAAAAAEAAAGAAPAGAPVARSCDTMQPILPAAIEAGEAFDFVMCNPPFFAAMEEAAQGPQGCYGGTEDEMATPGGEERFVGQMVEESFCMKERVHWFTSMVGRKATFRRLRQRLQAARGITAVRSTELTQGRTQRWALAWSFTVPPATNAMPLVVTARASEFVGFANARGQKRGRLA